jgi:coenzyme F420-reducing hydrogenase alpha subunit
MLLQQLGIHFPNKNMHQSIIARAIEIYYCVLEAIRIMEKYVYPDSSHIQPNIREGHGFGCTEAPRGMLWHRYEIDERGKVKSARIVPPTSQNQARIEDDLKVSLTHFGLDKSIEELRAYSEMIIRNYDPCISCSTHFIKLKVKHL